MSFIERYFQKDGVRSKINFDDLNRFIEEHIEENINLDYKGVEEGANLGEVVRGLAEDISAFLNTSGGLLIYGVSHKEESFKDKKGKTVRVQKLPDKITPCDVSLTKERLLHMFYSRIQPWNNNVRIVEVRDAANSSRHVFLIDIPKSKQAPHMANHRFLYRQELGNESMTYRQVYDAFVTNWIQKAEYVTNVYGPIYSEIDAFLKRKKFTSANRGRFDQVCGNFTYLWVRVDPKLRQKTERFYDKLGLFIRARRDAPRIIGDIVSDEIAKFYRFPKKGEYSVRIGIKADGGTIMPTVDALLLRKLSPKDFLAQECPTWEIKTIWYELLKHGEKTQDLSEKEFKVLFSQCRTAAENNERIAKLRSMEHSLRRTARQLLDEYDQI